MLRRDNSEFQKIIEPYVHHPKVLQLMNYSHHGTTRYEHSFRVAFHTYVITKIFHLNYISATKAAFLHDFYFDEVENESSRKKLVSHPFVASYNAEKYFGLTSLERDIIEKHMFPISLRVPKYLESWIVDFVDDYSAIYEKIHSTKLRVESLAHLFVLFLFTFIQ